MNDITTARMLLTTAALAAVAALFAGGANAKPVIIDDGPASVAVTTPATEPMTIPYLSHGVGVDESLYSGQSLTGVHAALQHDRSAETSSTVAPVTIPYLSHGNGVDATQFSGRPSLGLNGDSALTRVSAPEPQGLTGDSAVTRYPGTVSIQTTSSGSEFDWSSFGIGAGMAALLAAAIAGVFLTTRGRGGVALP